MSNVVLINNQQVKFEVVDNEIFTTSLNVSSVFEKEHQNIIAKIESLPNDDFRRLNFKASSKVRLNGLFEKDTKLYNLTRDGFSLLVMGFSGTKAYKWKVEFIKAFNKMEKIIKSNHSNLVLDTKFKEDLNTLLARNAELITLVRHGVRSSTSNDFVHKKSQEANIFKQKYYESLELTNKLLIEKLDNFDKLEVKHCEVKQKAKRTRLNDLEKNKILKLFANGISKAEISRLVNRSHSAIDKVIKDNL